jgi:capsular polysaccharide biosynthesis protein
VYSSRQANRYEASINLYAHPASTVTKSTDKLNELNLLSYGAVLSTLIRIAQSPRTMSHITSDLGLATDAPARYSIAAQIVPQTTNMVLWVDGPDPAVVLRIIGQLPIELDRVTAADFSIVVLSRLDGGPSVRKVQPDTRRNLLFGGLAGLIVGLVIASLSVPARRERPGHPAAAPSVSGSRARRGAISRLRNRNRERQTND